MPYETYATADDNVKTSGSLSEAGSVDVIRKQHNPGTDDEDCEDPDSDNDAEVVGSDVDSSQDSNANSTVAADEGEIIASSYQFLCTIAQQKAYVLCHKLPH